MKVRVGLSQISPTLGDLDRNIEIFRKAVAQAQEKGLELLIFPELGLTGYFLKDMVPAVAQLRSSRLLKEMKAISQKLSLVVGLVEESRDHCFYNSAFYLEGGEILHIHRKLYLPTYGMFDEQRYLARGKKVRAFETRFGRACMLICEDAWHPSTVYVASQDGAELLFIPSSSPGRGVEGGHDLAITRTWEGMNRIYALLFSQFCFFVNRVGYEDGVSFWGGSEVVDPKGEVQAKGPYFDEAFVEAEIDLQEVRRARISSPTLRDEDLGLTIRELQRIRKAQEAT